MGRSEQELGRPDEALPHYQRALEIDPNDAQAIELLARLQFVRERYLDSFDLFRALVERDPDNAELRANLGATLYHWDGSKTRSAASSMPCRSIRRSIRCAPPWSSCAADAVASRAALTWYACDRYERCIAMHQASLTDR